MTKMLSFISIIVLSGCATTAPPNSGFMHNYSMLREDTNGDKSLKWWEKEGFNWQQYQKLMLDTVVVHYHPQAGSTRINAETEKKLTNYFMKAVKEELTDEFTIVTTPGPDVLRVRASVSEIIPASPALNYPAMVVAFFPIDMGGAALEAEFLDSETNEILAAMVDRKMGSPLKPRGFTRLGYARAAFDSWAKELRIALETNP